MNEHTTWINQFAFRGIQPVWLYDRGWRRVFACLAIACALLGILLLSLGSAQAQTLPTTASAAVFMQYPDITVQALCPDTQTAPSTTTLFTLTEDNVVQKINQHTRTPLQLQTQTAIFVDLFDHKQTELAKIGYGLETLYRLYEAKTLTVTQDQLAVFAPTTTQTALDTIVNWTGDAGAVVNSTRAITTGRPFAALERTALIALLRATIKKFPPPDGKVRQTLLVFSDGMDTFTNEQLDVLIQEARAQQLQINTIFIQTGYSNINNLSKMAQGTGGYFYQLDPKDEKMLRDYPAGKQVEWNELWQPLKTRYALCNFTYRTHERQPTTLMLSGVISGQKRITQTYTIPTLAVTPPRLTITTPAAGQQITLSSTTTKGLVLPLTVHVSFDPYPVRQLSALTYTLKGPRTLLSTPQTSPISPTTMLTFAIPLSGLQTGGYFIAVEVRDELGLRSQDSIPFVLQPPPAPVAATPSATAEPTTQPTATPPTPTPEPQPTNFLSWVQTDFPYRLLLLLLPLFLILAGLYLFYRLRQNPQSGDDDSISLSPARGAKTVNAILYQVRPRAELPLQQIVKLSDEPSELPESLYTYLGDTQQTDKNTGESISLFHAQISLRDGKYRLVSQSGKPIKYRRNDFSEDVDPELFLNEHDIIILGKTEYRFYILDKPSAPNADSTKPL